MTSLGQRTRTIVSLDPAATPLWASTSAPTASFVQALAITATDDGSIFSGSHVSGPFDFAPHSTNAGGQQAYVIGRTSGTSTGTDELSAVMEMKAFPSPFSDAVQLLPAPSPNAQVSVTDGKGRLVYTGPCTATLGRNWTPGLYAVVVRNAGERSVVPVVKE